MPNKQLIEEAKAIKDAAYVPYSKFPVGAALRTKSGRIFTGCNIENAAYPVSCCAERVAIFKAISEGFTDFDEMAVAADTDRPVPPSGSCRQVISEFFQKYITITLTNLNVKTNIVTIHELHQLSFEPENLKVKLF